MAKRQHSIDVPADNAGAAPGGRQSGMARPHSRRSRLGAPRHPTWLDTLLERGQRFLIVVALLLFGRWLFDGPVRDWLHEQAGLSASLPFASASSTLLGPFARTTAGFDLAPTIAIPRSAADMAALPAHLRVPSIQVDTPVKEVFVVDDEWQVAEYAAGYLHGTGLPGSPGNVVIAGHAGLRGGVFRNLGSLAAGADVFVDAGGWRYRYRVREARAVAPTQLEVLDPTGTATLTLLTCTDWDTQRLIVTADLVEAKSLRGF